MITLENFESTDFPQLKEWVNTEEILLNWSGNLFKFPLTTESLEWYASKTNIPGTSDAFIFKAVDESGIAIGHISLGGISWKNRSARITRVIIGHARERGRGYCGQMMNQILKIGFDELKLHRISLGVYDTNISAIRCYERVGMKVEGIQRDVLLVNNKFWSMVEMAMLENEWRDREFSSQGV